MGEEDVEDVGLDEDTRERGRARHIMGVEGVEGRHEGEGWVGCGRGGEERQKIELFCAKR